MPLEKETRESLLSKLANLQILTPATGDEVIEKVASAPESPQETLRQLQALIKQAEEEPKEEKKEEEPKEEKKEEKPAEEKAPAEPKAEPVEEAAPAAPEAPAEGELPAEGGLPPEVAAEGAIAPEAMAPPAPAPVDAASLEAAATEAAQSAAAHEQAAQEAAQLADALAQAAQVAASQEGIVEDPAAAMAPAPVEGMIPDEDIGKIAKLIEQDILEAVGQAAYGDDLIQFTQKLAAIRRRTYGVVEGEDKIASVDNPFLRRLLGA